MQCYCDSQPVSCCVSTQESPTGELGDYSFPVEAEANCQASEVELPRSQDRDIAPEDSPGRNVSEESECSITIPGYYLSFSDISQASHSKQVGHFSGKMIFH